MADMVQNLSVPILVVEDNRTQGEYLRYVLEKEGYPVTIATSGKEALISISKSRPYLILTDVMMPEMDGYEATREIRKKETVRDQGIRRTPIVALTAHALDGDREISLQAGMDDHLSKPFTLDQLSEILAKNLPFQSAAPDVAEPSIYDGSNDKKMLQPDKQSDHEGVSNIDRAVINRIRAIEAQGSTNLLKTVITYYVDESPRIISSLRQAIAENNPESMQEFAHSFKSASANVGAMTIAELCKEMELEGRKGVIQRSSELLAQVEREFAAAAKTLLAEL